MDTPDIRQPIATQDADQDSVLARAFRILGAFGPRDTSLGLSALGTRSGLPKSTALRIARQLVELGALERTRNGEYVIGLGLLEMASLAPRGHGLRATALPFLEDLHRVTGQHVLLAVREGTEAVLVERLSARGAGTVRYRVGGRLPLATTGVGRVLLAHAPSEVAIDIIEHDAQPWRSPECRTPHDLRIALAEVRRNGFADFASSFPEPEPVTSVAAPVRTDDEVVAAVSVVAPTRLVQPREHRAAVMTVARAISRELASTPSSKHVTGAHFRASDWHRSGIGSTGPVA